MAMPTLSSIDWTALALTILALLAAFKFRVGTATLLLGAAILGQLCGMAGLIS